MALTLHISHPATGLRVEDCVYPNYLALFPGGQAMRGRVGGRGGNDEFLNLTWWSPREGLRFASVGRSRGGQRTPPAMPRLNGEQREAAQLSAGDRLEWNDFVVLVKEVAIAGPEVQRMTGQARHDDAALEVFADWLEANGSPLAAEWSRAMKGGHDRARLAVLARQLPLSFRALVSRGPVERCERGCGQQWEALAAGVQPWLRTCEQCRQTVSWCDDPSVPGRGPVVICPSVERKPRDLYPVFVVG